MLISVPYNRQDLITCYYNQSYTCKRWKDHLILKSRVKASLLFASMPNNTIIILLHLLLLSIMNSN